MSGIFSSLKLASDALGVFSAGIQTEAHNIANISTDAFEPLRATYATGPGGIGVRVDSIAANSSFATSNEIPDSSDQDIKRPSGTELATEFALMIRDQRSFDANAKVIEALDANAGTLLDTLT